MPKKMTKAERAAYMRDYRARKAVSSVNPAVEWDSLPGASERVEVRGGPLGTGRDEFAASTLPEPPVQVKPFRLPAPIDDCAWVSPAGDRVDLAEWTRSYVGNVRDDLVKAVDLANTTADGSAEILDASAFLDAYWQTNSTPLIRQIHPEYRARSDERARELYAEYQRRRAEVGR